MMRFCSTALFALVTASSVCTGWAQSAAKDVVLTHLSSFVTNAAPEMVVSPLSLDEVERIALENNPGVAVAVRRVALAEAHVPTVGALDDPMAMYRGWGVPLQRPWDYNAAQNMFSLSQTFPGG